MIRIFLLILLLLKTNLSLADDFEKYLNSGKKYFTECRHKENLAKEEFEKGWKLAPDNPEILYWLGITCYHLGDFERAKELLEKARELKPDDYRIHTYLSFTYGRISEANLIKQPYYNVLAMKEVNIALKLKPSCSHCYNAWGIGYSYLRLYGKAEEFLKKSIEVNPRNAYTYLQLGGIYLKTDRFDLAEKEFKRAISLAEKDVKEGMKNDEVPRAIALYYEEVKMWDNALKYAELALKWNPQDLQYLPKFSIKKLIKRIKEEKKLNKTIPHHLPDELIVGGVD